MCQLIKRLKQILIISCFLCLPAFHAAWAGLSADELNLVQIRLNEKLNFNSEILQIEDKVYAPLRQIADISEEPIIFDRASRIITFSSRADNLPVKIDPTNQTIQVGDSQLDRSTNAMLWVKQDFAIKDDVLIDVKLLEAFFGISIKYDDENLLLQVTVKRPLKSLKQERHYLDGAEGDIIHPKEVKLGIRSLQFNISTLSNTTSGSATSGQPLTFGNQLNLNVMGDAYGGIYRIGPTLFQNGTTLGLSGFQQSWGKILKNNLGIVAGDSVVQLDPINLPSSSILGLRVGSPKDLNLKPFDGLSFEGVCEVNSEILLYFNNQVIARQVCKTGKYTFGNIPRLIGSNNNLYRLIQNNTDGTQVTLREEVIPYYDGLISAKTTRWNAFVGRPSFTTNLFTSDGSSGGNLFQDSSTGNKAVAGAAFKYGLTNKANIEVNASADQNITNANNNFREQYGSLNQAPLFSDTRYLQGQTVSFGIVSRPTDNFGISTYAALSRSQDTSPGAIFRSGTGYALYSNYDFRHKNFYNQGSAYYYSPEFYTPLSIFSNRMGGNMSFGLGLKKQSIGGNIRIDTNNLDGKSFGGKYTSKNLLLNYNNNLGKYTSVSSSLNVSQNNSDLIDQTNISTRSILRQKVNKRFDLTMSTGTLRQIDNKTNTPAVFIADITPGGTLYLGSERQNMLNFGASFFTDNINSQYVQGRFKVKSFVYQPSITRFASSSGDVNWLISQGVFYEKSNGLRLGLEYLLGQSQSAGGVNGRGSGQTNHSIRLTMLSNVGFVDKKPYLTNTQSSGYVKGTVFVDLNGNGLFDQSEKPVSQATIMFRDKPIKVNSGGQFLIRDVPKGVYEAYLDPVSLPLALVPQNQAFKFEIEPGRLTELKFTTQVNAGSVSGKIMVKDLSGKIISPENIVLIARDSTGKEVAYTYVERNGIYTISELPPGEYTISIDELDIRNRKLSLNENLKKVNIPFTMDEIVEINDVNFDAMQSQL